MSTKVFKQGIALTAVSADPSSPKDGELQLSDGTSRAAGYYRYDSGTSSWLPLGGGGGSLDILHQEDFETTTASDFSTGNNAAPDAAGTGTLDGTLADEASTPIGSISSLKYTMGSTSADDFFLNGEDIALDEKQTNNWLGINFYYTYNGDDDDIRFVVLDQDDAELTTSIEYIKSNSTATRFSTAVYIPDGTTGLRYGFQVVTGNSGKIFIVDDLELSTNPFVYKNLIETNSVSLSGSDGRAITLDTEDIFWSGTGLGWTSGADGTSSNYTVQKSNSIVSIKGSAVFTGSDSTFMYLYKNSIEYKLLGFSNGVSYDINFVSTKGEFSKGDTISIRSSATKTYPNNSTEHWLNIIEQSTTEHVVTPASVTTEYFTMAANASNFWDSTGNQDTFDISLIPLTDSDLVEWNDTTETRLVAKKDCIIDVTVNAQSTGAFSFLYMLDSSGTVITQCQNHTNVYGIDVTAQIKLNSGDYVYWRATNLVGRTGGVTLTARPAEVTFLAAVPVQQVAYVKEVQASGTASHSGATFTQGGWRTRFLNTLEGDTGFISLSSNQFTLASGKYLIEASAPAYFVNGHMAKLYNITDSSDDILGQATNAINTGNGGGTSSLIAGTIEISSSKTFEIQHYCTTTRAGNGFGTDLSFSVNNIFTQVKITKLS